jgi:hypothetical protein
MTNPVKKQKAQLRALRKKVNNLHRQADEMQAAAGAHAESDMAKFVYREAIRDAMALLTLTSKNLERASELFPALTPKEIK